MSPKSLDGKSSPMAQTINAFNAKRRLSSDDQCLMVFAKAPIQGEVKTRLAAEIGTETATGLYRAFVSDLLSMLSQTPYPVQIHFWPPDARKQMREWLGTGYELIAQTGRDLGEKMGAAFSLAFSRNYRQAVLVGTDFPDLPTSFIHDAFAALSKSPAVIGPSKDGGYFLVGFDRDFFLPAIFSGIHWGSTTVLAETAAIFKHNKTPVHYINQWADIDTHADLMEFYRRAKTTSGPKAAETLNFLDNMGLTRS